MRVTAAVVLIVVVAVAAMFMPGCAAKHREPRGAGAGASAGAGGTAAVEVADRERWRKTDEAVVEALNKSIAASRGHAGGITHVVLLWLKQPGDAAGIAKIVQTSRQFRQIPGVRDVRVGRPVASTRPVVDATFDVGLAISFADEAALHAYETHPQHVKAVTEVLRPLAGKTVVYDIREADGADGTAAPKSK